MRQMQLARGQVRV